MGSMLGNMSRLRHILLSGGTAREIGHLTREIERDIEQFLREAQISPQKHAHLENARAYIRQAACHADREELDACRQQYAAFAGAMAAYAASGSVYLLRHPEKEAAGMLRMLTDHGVRQAGVFARRLQQEILLSPKRVRVVICTSEVKRTATFALIISHVNDAKRTGQEIILEQKQDRRLFFGPKNKEFEQLYASLQAQLGAEEGDFEIVRQWIAQQGAVGALVRSGNLRDLWRAKDEMKGFVQDALHEVSNPEYYTIVIGITHSMVFASWLLNAFSEEEVGRMIPSTAEFAKIENGTFYYRNHWY